VTQANAIQDTVGGNVGGCVAEVIQRLKFPKPDGGTVDVDKSFIFQAGN